MEKELSRGESNELRATMNVNRVASRSKQRPNVVPGQGSITGLGPIPGKRNDQVGDGGKIGKLNKMGADNSDTPGPLNVLGMPMKRNDQVGDGNLEIEATTIISGRSAPGVGASRQQGRGKRKKWDLPSTLVILPEVNISPYQMKLNKMAQPRPPLPYRLEPVGPKGSLKVSTMPDVPKLSAVHKTFKLGTVREVPEGDFCLDGVQLSKSKKRHGEGETGPVLAGIKRARNPIAESCAVPGSNKENIGKSQHRD